MKSKLLTASALMIAMSASYAVDASDTSSSPQRSEMLLAQTAVLKSTEDAKADMNQQSATGAQKSEASEVDRTFAQKAVESNATEIQASEMAKEKAQNDDVKDYAERMIDDHSDANEELMALINETIPEKWRPAKELDAAKKKQMESLEKLSGSEFDREYMAMMTKSHQQTVQLFEKQAQEGKNEKLKSFAEEMLPDLKEHTKMAQELAQQLDMPASQGK